jgi:hypothetical protein
MPAGTSPTPATPTRTSPPPATPTRTDTPAAARAADHARILDVSGELLADLRQTVRRHRRGCADHHGRPQQRCDGERSDFQVRHYNSSLHSNPVNRITAHRSRGSPPRRTKCEITCCQISARSGAHPFRRSMMKAALLAIPFPLRPLVYLVVLSCGLFIIVPCESSFSTAITPLRCAARTGSYPRMSSTETITQRRRPRTAALGMSDVRIGTDRPRHCETEGARGTTSGS